MLLINGRTPEQWRAFDRGKLVVALILAAILVVMWVAGMGPGRAAACCTVPEAGPAAAATAATPRPATPEPVVDPTPTAEAATTDPVPPPAEDDCPPRVDFEVDFATYSSELTSTNRDALGRLAPCLVQGRYEIAGHADSSGNDAINDPLAEARARSVVEFMVSRGVDADRLSARGYGSRRPDADNATPEGRAANRRVEITEQ